MPSLSDEPRMANHSALLRTDIFVEWLAEAEGPSFGDFSWTSKKSHSLQPRSSERNNVLKNEN